jgi:uncharacterized protein
MECDARALVAGSSEADVVALDEPVSFWGGFDAESGRLIDRHHPQLGTSLSGRTLVMPAGRGSSSSSSVFAEAVRAGTAPSAVVLGAPDPIIALGAVIARELYGRAVPVVVVGESDYAAVASARRVRIEESGRLTILG